MHSPCAEVAHEALHLLQAQLRHSRATLHGCCYLLAPGELAT